MAIIGEIRKRPVLILVIIGLALVAFVMADLFSSAFGSSAEQTEVVMIDDEPISPEDQQLLTGIEQYRQKDLTNNYGGFNGPPSASTAFANRMAWKQFAEILMIRKQAELINMDVTEKEVEYLFYSGDTNTVSIYVSPFLTLDPMSDEERQNIRSMADFGKSRFNRNNNQSIMKNMRLRDKYLTLLKSGMYVTDLEAQRYANLTDGSKRISYVFKSFDAPDMPDANYNVSDDEIKAYYEAHKNEAVFKQDNGKLVEVVEIPVIPTEQDISLIKTSIEKSLLKSFQNDLMDDSLFSAQNRGVMAGRNVSQFRKGDSLNFVQAFKAEYYNATFSGSDEVQVFGPYKNTTMNMDTYKMLKVRNKRPIAFREMTISKAGKSDQEYNALLDSVFTIVRGDQNKFDEIYTKFNDDTTYASSNGITPYMDYNTMSRLYTNQIARNVFVRDSASLMNQPTAAGMKIMQVYAYNNADSSEFVLASTYEKRILPSVQTMSTYMKGQAMEVMQNSDEVPLDQLPAELNYKYTSLSFSENDLNIREFAQSQVQGMYEFVKNSEEGDMIKLDTDDKVFVVHIKKELTKGPKSLESTEVYDQVKGLAIDEKKAQDIISKLQGVSSLEEAAQKTNGSIAQKELRFIDKTIAAGSTGEKEELAVGAVFGATAGQIMSKPIVGSNGVYLIKVDAAVPAPQPTDLASTIATLQNQNGGAFMFNTTLDENRIKYQANVTQQPTSVLQYYYFKTVSSGDIYNALKAHSNLNDKR